MAELSDFIEDKDINDCLAEDPEVIAAKIELAELATEYWKSIVPVDDSRYPPRPPGTDREDISVFHRGHTVAVVNDDPIAHIIEYGSVQVPESACRARTEEYFNNGGGAARQRSKKRRRAAREAKRSQK
jgi:hypothetical protein